MSGSGHESPLTVDDDSLRRVLQDCLQQHCDTSCELKSLRRCKSIYSSSFVIEDLVAEFEDGSKLELVFKNLSTDSLLANARGVKPAFLRNPRREIEVYEKILASADLSTAHFYGSVVDEKNGLFWLFLEKVPGQELYLAGEFETWLESARWLARLHLQFEGRAEILPFEVPLLLYDDQFYRVWPERAQRFLASQPGDVQQSLEHLIGQYDRIIGRLMTLPATLMHGEFYASNILTGTGPGGVRICPVDWEMAALGPGLMDLAALISGQWSDAEKAQMVRAYQAALSTGENDPDKLEKLFQDLAYCQLHIAMQWLGWSAQWSPPAEHRQDWINEAFRLVEQLDL